MWVLWVCYFCFDFQSGFVFESMKCYVSYASVYLRGANTKWRIRWERLKSFSELHGNKSVAISQTVCTDNVHWDTSYVYIKDFLFKTKKYTRTKAIYKSRQIKENLKKESLKNRKKENVTIEFEGRLQSGLLFRLNRGWRWHTVISRGKRERGLVFIYILELAFWSRFCVVSISLSFYIFL